jgi:hypothetical protein
MAKLLTGKRTAGVEAGFIYTRFAESLAFDIIYAWRRICRWGQRYFETLSIVLTQPASCSDPRVIILIV